MRIAPYAIYYCFLGHILQSKIVPVPVPDDASQKLTFFHQRRARETRGEEDAEAQRRN
jgi:hypothetical protein